MLRGDKNVGSLRNQMGKVKMVKQTLKKGSYQHDEVMKSLKIVKSTPCVTIVVDLLNKQSMVLIT